MSKHPNQSIVYIGGNPVERVSLLTEDATPQNSPKIIGGSERRQIMLCDPLTGEPLDLQSAATSVTETTHVSAPVYAGGKTSLSIFTGGQSLMENMFISINSTNTPALFWARRIRYYMGFPQTAAMTWYAEGAYPGTAVVSDGSTKTSTDFTVRIENTARGGSSLTDVGNPSCVDPAQQGGFSNYWWNTQNNSALSSGGALDAVPNTPGPLLRRLLQTMAGRQCDMFVWSQGEAELSYIAASPANSALWQSVLAKLFATVRAAANNPSLPIVLHRIGRHTAAVDTDVAAVRDAQTAVVMADPNCYIAADEFDKQFGATLAFTGSVTSGNLTIPVANTTGLVVGQEIFGTGLVGGTWIKTITANTNITVDASRTPTATAANTTLRMRDVVHLYPGVADALDTDTNSDAVNDSYNALTGFYQVCYQSARSIVRILQGTTKKVFGPQIVDMQIVPGSSRIRLKVQHDLGTGLITRNSVTVLTTAAAFFEVSVNGTVLTVTDVQLVTGTNDMYELVFGAAIPAGLLAVRYGRALAYDAGGLFHLQDFKGLLTDNSVSQMPLLPYYATLDMAS